MMDLQTIYNIIIAATPAITAVLGIVFALIKIVAAIRSSSANYNKTIQEMQDMLMQSRDSTRDLETRLEQLIEETAKSRRGPDLNDKLDKGD